MRDPGIFIREMDQIPIDVSLSSPLVWSKKEAARYRSSNFLRQNPLPPGLNNATNNIFTSGNLSAKEIATFRPHGIYGSIAKDHPYLRWIKSKGLTGGDWRSPFGSGWETLAGGGRFAAIRNLKAAGVSNWAIGTSGFKHVYGGLAGKGFAAMSIARTIGNIARDKDKVHGTIVGVSGLLGEALGTMGWILGPGGAFAGQIVGMIAGEAVGEKIFSLGKPYQPIPKQFRMRMGGMGYFRDSEGAMTMREFAMKEIARTGLSGRRLLGSEGFVFHG